MGRNSPACVDDHQHIIHRRQTDRPALAPLAHHRAFRTGTAARAAAADRVRFGYQALVVPLADDARIKLDELALPLGAAPAQPARFEHHTCGIVAAARWAARPLTAFITGQTVNDRGEADPIETLMEHARVVVLVPAIAVVLAPGNAITVRAILTGLAPRRALVLGTRRRVRCEPRDHRRCQRREETPAVPGRPELPGQTIESSGLHETPFAAWNRRPQRAHSVPITRTARAAFQRRSARPRLPVRAGKQPTCHSPPWNG